MSQALSRNEVINWLKDWARWKLSSGVALGYPSMVSFVRQFSGGNGRPDYDDVDSWCIEMNDAVNMLPIIHKEMVRMEHLTVYKNIAVKAHYMGISKRCYHQYINKSYDLIAKILDNRLHTVRECDTNMLNQLELPPDKVREA